MKKIRAVVLSLTIFTFLFASINLVQAAYPEKPIEFIIPFGAGGGADIEGRLLAKEMSKILGVPVVAINKPGAGGAVTYTYVKNAKPDGYTVAWNSTSILTVTNIGNVPYGHDAMTHVGRVEYQPMVFAVKSGGKWNSMKDFEADCKKNPNSLKVGNSSIGSATHIGAIAVANAIGCDVIHVPLGIKRRNAGLLSGETDAMIAPLTGAIKLAKAKKIMILSHLSAGTNPVVPDVPSMKSLGYDAELDLFRGLSVPKGTPAEVTAKLSDAMGKAAQSSAFMDMAKKNGFTVAPMDVATFEDYLERDNKVVKAIMEVAGLYQSKAKK
ncbi:MAG: tripartite tricarboxylate transporter substrate binding protein [SAR324 cluster bacterium]|nr:tripartite tricarboxylate transporter substrate binding protein [SAR324 cluster bacterium]